MRLDLGPWLKPGEDLKRSRKLLELAVPMNGCATTEGALLLGGMRPAGARGGNSGQDRLRADDLLPVELLTARLQATRSQTLMFEKLADAEKFAGLGQLAAGVTQQLNNPLTVVLGYSSLLFETASLGTKDRKAVESILTEARRMRSTLESLSRLARPDNNQPSVVSVAELLADIEQLYRPEFLQRSIEFRTSVRSGLPQVLCNPQQLRQAVLQCLQFAMGAVQQDGIRSRESKTIRLEASSEGNLVQIQVSHSGPAFANPERVFDPFWPPAGTGETPGAGLSLCGSILRNQNGRVSAVNLEPRGAAIILELRAA